MQNYNLLKNDRTIKIATNKKNKKITELLQLKEDMISNKIDNTIIKKIIDEQYKIINQEYEKAINKKVDKAKIINKKKKEALDFLFKNKIFLELNNASPTYIEEYVKKQYEDINKTYVLDDGIDFID